MSTSQSTTSQKIAASFAGLWLLSVCATSLAIAAAPLYQPGEKLGLCSHCAVGPAKTVVAKVEPAKAG